MDNRLAHSRIKSMPVSIGPIASAVGGWRSRKVGIVNRLGLHHNRANLRSDRTVCELVSYAFVRMRTKASDGRHGESAEDTSASVVTRTRLSLDLIWEVRDTTRARMHLASVRTESLRN